MAPSPRFNLKNKNDASTLISMHYWLKGKRIVVSTSQTINPKHWNDKKMRVRDSAGIADAKTVNDVLDRFSSAATSVERGFRTHGEIPSVKQFKDELKRKLNGARKSSKMTFISFIEDFINERAAIPTYAKATLKVYKTTQKHYTAFTKGNVIEFKDVNSDHLADFVRFLRRRGDKQDNTVHKAASTLRTIFNNAGKKGFHQNPKLHLADANVTRKESDSVYLRLDELDRIEALDLSEDVRLGRVRNLFLLLAFTGLRFSDLAQIRSTNIQNVDGKDILRINVSKTKSIVNIPVHPKVKAILNMYSGVPDTKITDQKFNEYVKEVCKLAGINDSFKKREHKGKMEIKELSKWELVSSHTARRSFATNAYKLGMHPLAIMKITGHKSYGVFMKYIRVENEENALMMADHKFFTT